MYFENLHETSTIFMYSSTAYSNINISVKNGIQIHYIVSITNITKVKLGPSYFKSYEYFIFKVIMASPFDLNQTYIDSR